jgi:hypothetical protein
VLSTLDSCISKVFASAVTPPRSLPKLGVLRSEQTRSIRLDRNHFEHGAEQWNWCVRQSPFASHTFKAAPDARTDCVSLYKNEPGGTGIVENPAE